MLTSQMIKDFAVECGADDVGIAPMDRFEGAPKEMDPRYIFPEAKSMIGFIFRIPRGYIRGIEEGTHFYQYPSLGYGAINEDIAPATLYDVGRLIEDHGHEAAVFRNTGGRGAISDMDGKPGFTSSPEEAMRACRHTQAAKNDGRPAPDVMPQFRISAFLCGLGEVGYSKMFLSPKFGPMNRQAFLFTDAELEYDPIYEGPTICDRCMACVAACPGKCIDPKETVKVKLAGHDVEWGKLYEWDCFLHYIGANKANNPFMPRDVFKGIPGGDEIMRGKKRISAEEYDELANRVRESYPGAYKYNPPKCGGCLRACVANLEKKGKLTNKFKNKFRTEKPWKIDIEKPIEINQ